MQHPEMAQEKAKRVSGKLTQKQQAFINEYLSNGGNAAHAYRIAFKSKGNTATCGRAGHDLLRHPNIAPKLAEAAARAEKAAEKVIEAHELDRAWVIERLIHEARTSAAGARVTALGLLGKSLGMFVDTSQQLGPDGKPIDPRQTYTLVIER